MDRISQGLEVRVEFRALISRYSADSRRVKERALVAIPDVKVHSQMRRKHDRGNAFGLKKVDSFLRFSM